MLGRDCVEGIQRVAAMEVDAEHVEILKEPIHVDAG